MGVACPPPTSAMASSIARAIAGCAAPLLLPQPALVRTLARKSCARLTIIPMSELTATQEYP